MNVLEKFIEKYNQCIILLSGFEKLHLEEYAKQLSKDFNFELIKFDYPNFDKLNDDIKKFKNKGLIIYGLSFPNDSLSFKPNYHVAISGNKTLVDDDEKFKIFNENTSKSIINKFKNIKDLNYHEEIYDDIFNLVIDMVMRKIYGDKYEEMQKEYAKLSEKEKEPIKKDEEETNSEKEEKTQNRVSSGGKKFKKTRGGAKKQKRIMGTRIVMSVIKV
jgi:hypothetical protein